MPLKYQENQQTICCFLWGIEIDMIDYKKSPTVLVLFIDDSNSVIQNSYTGKYLK